MAKPTRKSKHQKEEDQTEQKIAAGDADQLPEENVGNVVEVEAERDERLKREIAVENGGPEGEANLNAKGRLRRAANKVNYDEEVACEEEDGPRKRKRGRKRTVKQKEEATGASATDRADGGQKRGKRGRPSKRSKVKKSDTESEEAEGGDEDEKGDGDGEKSLNGAKYERWDPKVYFSPIYIFQKKTFSFPFLFMRGL